MYYYFCTMRVPIFIVIDSTLHFDLNISFDISDRAFHFLYKICTTLYIFFFSLLSLSLFLSIHTYNIMLLLKVSKLHLSDISLEIYSSRVIFIRLFEIAKAKEKKKKTKNGKREKWAIQNFFRRIFFSCCKCDAVPSRGALVCSASAPTNYETPKSYAAQTKNECK